MGLEDIKKAILDEAKKTADGIRMEGEKKTEEKRQVWAEKINEKKKKIIASAAEKISQKIQQTKFIAQTEVQREILSHKQEIISETYNTALMKLGSLNDDQYYKLMEKLIQELPDVEGELISAVGKESLLKKAMGKSGRKYHLSRETINSQGGFLLKTNEIIVNQSFEALIDSLKEKTVLEATRMLFRSV